MLKTSFINFLTILKSLNNLINKDKINDKIDNYNMINLMLITLLNKT